MRTLRIGDEGTDVMEIQATLAKAGYNPGSVDRIFGRQTEQAVMLFQKQQGLLTDGIIGVNTYRKLQDYLLGYFKYTIRRGDTFYRLAKKMNIPAASLQAANPKVPANRLIAGMSITAPYDFDVVDTNIDYTYTALVRDLEALQARYPFLEIFSIGNSVLNKKLYCIRLGTGPNEVHYNGAHHALEWITAPLLMKFVENVGKAYIAGTKIRGYDVRSVLRQNRLYLVPMVNPDGVDLVLDGLTANHPYREELIDWNGGSLDFSQNWQANIRGVDLNHNYDALWELSKQAESTYDIHGPGPTRYSGSSPESEPETKSLADFTRERNFQLVLAFHSQGEVFYWTFDQKTPPKARPIGEAFAKMTGYALEMPVGITSYAGYKDWFIDKFLRPGYTVEVGLGKSPLPMSQFPKIYQDNEELLIAAPDLIRRTPD